MKGIEFWWGLLISAVVIVTLSGIILKRKNELKDGTDIIIWLGTSLIAATMTTFVIYTIMSVIKSVIK